MQKDVEFQPETKENQATAILKKVLCNDPALKTLDVSDGSGQIVVGVDASLEGWGSILQQENKNHDWNPSHYESGLWHKAKKR